MWGLDRTGVVRTQESAIRTDGDLVTTVVGPAAKKLGSD